MKRKNHLTIVSIILVTVCFSALLSYASNLIFDNAKNVTRIIHGTPPTTYYIEEYSPMPEGDYAYKLYRKRKFFIRELIGKTGRLYIYRGFDPDDPGATITFHNPQNSGEQLFYYHIGTQTLEAIE